MVKNDLLHKGYSTFSVREAFSAQDIAQIHKEFDGLESDFYAPSGVKRFRRYGNGVIVPWRSDAVVEWMPVTIDSRGHGMSGYDQGSNNPEHENIRYFHALSAEVKATDLLKSLVMRDFKDTFWPEKGLQSPIYFGVHFVRIISSSISDRGISSPDCFHQDGEPFTFAHLVRRSKSTDGGVNYIGSTGVRNMALDEVPESEILAEFELGNFMDSFAVHDPRVSHYVTPIIKSEADAEDAERCMILIDFSPMVQKI
ncbi:TPA: 2OG-Fe dioxygenase family protein [Pseudomonas aeruginosa]|nr:2OG-Fe dioxygenase family protein [Pseudomonas aeruginosa]